MNSFTFLYGERDQLVLKYRVLEIGWEFIEASTSKTHK